MSASPADRGSPPVALPGPQWFGTEKPEIGPGSMPRARPLRMTAIDPLATLSAEKPGLSTTGRDFLASLGGDVDMARKALDAVSERSEPSLSAALALALHRLGAAARVARFESLARLVFEATAAMDRAATGGRVVSGDLRMVAQLLDDLPSLALADLASREAPASTLGPFIDEPAPLSVLFAGGKAGAEALRREAGPRLDMRHTGDAQEAIDLAKELFPDVIVVDAELDAAAELVDALFDDTTTERVPVVVVGPDDMLAHFVALGVCATLTTPASPSALLRACESAATRIGERTTRVSFGEPTLEQLVDRLAEEVRSALATDERARAVRVPLGDGAEVLGALWGAIARVRELVTARTDGRVRFSGKGPEGAFPFAPSLGGGASEGSRGRTSSRSTAADVNLVGKRVVVADDDPAVTWFLADLLRNAGCEVHEALDGTAALDAAREAMPDVVLSDILMPGLDGFALCRALKRDVALGDTPVILLSWKEDLLQRVRELGAAADGYLRKEADARSILARVREVLRPRASIAARLRAGGEVHGRIDGLSVRALLELVADAHPNARFVLRDASFRYELDLRGGSIVRIVRAAPTGPFAQGVRLLDALLGVRAGRFSVQPMADDPSIAPEASLREQLAAPIARLRGAQAVLSGVGVLGATRVVVDEAMLDGYLDLVVPPMRALVERIVRGDAPRDLLLQGVAPPAMLEDALAYLVARGAVCSVQGMQREDLLEAAVCAAAGVPAPTATHVVQAPAPAQVERRPTDVAEAHPLLVAPDALRARPVAVADVADVADIADIADVAVPPPPRPGGSGKAPARIRWGVVALLAFMGLVAGAGLRWSLAAANDVSPLFRIGMNHAP